MAYDIVIFGATGFTGQFVVEELAQVLAAPNAPKLTWAVAGRNEDKLKKVWRRELSIFSVVAIDLDAPYMNIDSINDWL